MTKLYRSCPICQKETGEILHYQSFILPKDNPLPTSYNVVYCERCGFVFADTPATQNIYNKYYAELSKYEDKTVATGTGVNPEDSLRLKKTARDICDVISDKDASILDIGCANGGLLLELKKLGYKNVYGTDPSQACIRNVSRLGIGIEKRGLFSTEGKNSKKYDLVVLTHVLEHICDLRTALGNITNLVARDGIVYIEVPDASRYHELYVIPYYYIDSEHINHFDKNSLTNLFAQFGYKFVSSISKNIRVSPTQDCPAVGVFFRFSGGSSKSPLVSSDNVKNSLLDYLSKSKQDSSFTVINELAQSQKSIIIWGVGSFTQRLLASTNLSKCNIEIFIDNDSNKYGSYINGKKIHSANSLREHESPVLICSAIKKAEIAKQIHAIDPNRKIIDWESKMKNKLKIFITGAGGFIGRNLTEYFSTNHEVFAPSFQDLDLTSQEAVDEFFAGKKFDAVVHCAVKPGHRNAGEVDNQLYINMRMFSNVMKNREKFNKFFFLGSGLSYDIRYYKPKMKEDYFGTHVPVDEGGLSKYLISNFLSLNEGMFDLRVFGIFGKYEDYAIRFISNMICKSIFDLPLTIKQSRKFDYIFIEDLPPIIEYFINNKTKYYTYNITPDKSIELVALAKKVRAIANKDLPIIVSTPGLGEEYSGDNSRLKSEIKDLKFTPIDEAIKRLYDWYVKNKHMINRESLIIDK